MSAAVGALLRGLVDEMAPDPRGLGPTSLRLVRVTARDAASGTCTIAVSGDTDPDRYVPGVRVLEGVVPRVETGGTPAFALQNRSDWLLVGLWDHELPKCKLRSTATQSIGTTPEKFSFNAAGGSTSYDEDNDGVATMADRTNSRIYARWPGKYHIGAKTIWADPAAVTRTIIDIRLNGTTDIARFDVGTEFISAASVSVERALATGDFVEMFLTSSQAALTAGSATDELGSALWLHYLP